MNPLRPDAIVDYQDELVAVIRHDARDLPLEDESVDLICCSPPYFALRSYRDDGEHYAGQIGSEDTPDEWLDALDECMVEWGRVLKPSGSIFVNLGDKYAGGQPHSDWASGPLNHGAGVQGSERLARQDVALSDELSVGFGTVRSKSLMGLPWRFAIHQIDNGWILRAEVVWDKPNGLPESVTDRVRRSHEQWFHMVKEPRYFSGIAEIREPQVTHTQYNPESGRYSTRYRDSGEDAGELPPSDVMEESKYLQSGNSNQDGEKGRLSNRGNQEMVRWNNPLGRLPGSVWSIPSEPLLIPDETRELLDLPDHFAAFPQEWPRRIILGWSPTGICTVCGEGRRPVIEIQQQEGLNGTPVETRRREPSQADTEAIAGFIRHHREIAGLTRGEVDEACGTNTYASWWEGRKGGIFLPNPTMWRRLAEVLDLPDIWDHIMLDTYMRPTGQLTSGDVVLSGRHETRGSTGMSSSAALTGYVCACPTPDAPTTPSLIVDPFGGTGTVAGVAKTLGRYGISNDLSASYNRLAVWRITQSGHFTKTEQRSWADRQGQLL